MTSKVLVNFILQLNTKRDLCFLQSSSLFSKKKKKSQFKTLQYGSGFCIHHNITLCIVWAKFSFCLRMHLGVVITDSMWWYLHDFRYVTSWVQIISSGSHSLWIIRCESRPLISSKRSDPDLIHRSRSASLIVRKLSKQPEAHCTSTGKQIRLD